MISEVKCEQKRTFLEAAADFFYFRHFFSDCSSASADAVENSRSSGAPVLFQF